VFATAFDAICDSMVILPKLLLIARRFCAKAFPRRQMGVLALNPA